MPVGRVITVHQQSPLNILSPCLAQREPIPPRLLCFKNLIVIFALKVWFAHTMAQEPLKQVLCARVAMHAQLVPLLSVNRHAPQDFTLMLHLIWISPQIV